MAEADKLNIDSIIQRLLEGKSHSIGRYLFTEVAILANTGRLDNGAPASLRLSPASC